MPVCRQCRADYRAGLHERAKADPGDSKNCRRCGEALPLGEFSLDRRSPDGYSPRCKQCRALGRKDDPVTAKDRLLRWKFGIGLDEYEAMLSAQGGGCAACGATTLQARRRYLDVDHDHQSGRVRALLCSPCNTALGLLREDPTRIEKLRAYAMRHAAL